MMNCQKCRTPLKLDGSLQDLNPAALDLLVGSTAPSLDSNTTTSRIPYPQERRDLYTRVSQDANPPVFKRVIPPHNQGFGTLSAMAASTKAGLKDNPTMSFVMLTDSQVVPQAATNGQTDSQPKPKAKRSTTAPQDSNDPKQTLSHPIESTTRLFEILSSRSDIDHPICTECTELLLSSLQSRLAASTKERDAYIAFLKTLTNNLPTPSAVSAAQTALSNTRAAESRAFADLVTLEQEKASLDAELAELEAESHALDREEQSFWRSRNAFALTLSSFQNDRDALNAAYDHDAHQLERLQRTNVYNDTFCIGHDGFFGTINGLRLGRLPPPQNVDWAEINAAWGTACLLLATVAEKLGFAFQGYKLKPMGSTSRIDRIEYPPQPPQPPPSTSTPQSDLAANPPTAHPKITPLDLFSSGDLPLGRMLLHRRLDNGMVAFLECVRQLGEFVETGSSSPSSHNPHSHSQPASKRSPPPLTSPKSNTSTSTTTTTTTTTIGDRDRDRGGGIKLPYEIQKDRIGDASIRLGVSQDEAWTRACKYALTCCKFLLAHASNVGGGGGR